MVKLPAHRLANKILAEHNRPDQNRTLRICCGCLSELILELKQLFKLFTTAIDKQWLASAVKLRKRIGYVTDSIEGRVKSIGPDTNQIIAGLRNYPTQLELIEDLKAVEKEFGDLFYDPEESCIVVHSENITFDDVNLGSFELRIPINPYNSTTVVACTPNRPVEDDVTTHPHIQNDKMCLGNGRDQFDDAMQQGRILDAFDTLNSILVTYNPGSAYIKIEHWNTGPDDYINCNDCGDSTEAEELFTCEECNSGYCGDCVYECGGTCDERYCDYCMSEECSICKNKRLCNSCLYKCKTCDKIFCDECINNPDEDKEQNCANCQKDRDEGLSVEVRPECVGQTMLFAG